MCLIFSASLAVGHHRTQEIAFPSLKAAQQGFQTKVLKKIVPENNNSPLKSDGFSINKKSDKILGQSPSKHPSLFSRYIMGNNHVPSSQRLDHTGKRTKESKIGERNDPKGGYREGTEVCCDDHTLPYFIINSSY
jgi:hypothetical protein